jgi:hypothetical protein
MRIHISPSVIVDDQMLLATLAPTCRNWNVLASAKFLRASVLLPHHGLADAITPGQISFTVDAGQMLRSNGVAKAIAKRAPSFDRMNRARFEFSFSYKEFAATWTFFQDMQIVRCGLCCAIFANVLLRTSSL